MALDARQPRAKIHLTALAWLRYRIVREVTVDAVYVTPLHRFGNALHQLGNASLVAQKNGVRHVVIGRHHTFRKPTTFAEDKHLSFRLPSANLWWRGRAVLVGRFFWDEEFPDTCNPGQISTALRGIGSSVIEQERVSVWGADVLVIHLRSGDVFSDPAPRKYGQPPLSFYTLIVSSKKWSQIVVVSEDTNNPVFDGLVSYCRDREIPCVTYSGDLLSDLHVLAGAKNLVVAAGTFGRAVIACSDEIEAVYEFEQTGFLYPLPSSVSHHRVVDVAGEYRQAVLSGNWKNTPEQKELMVSYPQENLGFVDVARSM